MPVVDLRPAANRLVELISAVPDADLGRPTPCTEYRVGDLLDHIRGLTIAFGGAAAKSAGPSADMGPSGDAASLDTDWRTSLPVAVRSLAEAWQDPAAWSGMTRVGGQDLPGEVAGVVAFGELSVHGWDLSRGTGIAFEPDPDGVPALFDLVRQTFGSAPDAPRGPAFGPLVPISRNAPQFEQILGLLGRDPAWPNRHAGDAA